MSARTSEAAVLIEYQQPLQNRRYPVPENLGDGEALFRI